MLGYLILLMSIHHALSNNSAWLKKSKSSLSHVAMCNIQKDVAHCNVQKTSHIATSRQAFLNKELLALKYQLIVIFVLARVSTEIWTREP
jgi:hypothetical protein